MEFKFKKTLTIHMSLYLQINFTFENILSSLSDENISYLAEVDSFVPKDVYLK